MLRRLLMVGLLTAGLLLTGAPAFGAPPDTQTTTQKDLVETFVDVIPSCAGGPPYTVTTTSNLVEHSTTFADGRVHDTFTQTGTAVGGAARGPDSADLHRQVHDLGRLQRQRPTVNGTFTFNLHATPLGRLDVQQPHVDHFNVRPDGTVNEFFHCH